MIKMYKKFTFSFLFVSFFNINTLSSSESVLASINNKPVITCNQLKENVINLLSQHKKELKGITQDTLYLSYETLFNELLFKHLFISADQNELNHLQGISLFLDYVKNYGDDARSLNAFIETCKNMNNRMQFMTVSLGVGQKFTSEMINEVALVKLWIEININEIELLYTKRKNALHSKNLNISIPSFEEVKNLIGYFLFLKIYQSDDEISKMHKVLCSFREQAAFNNVMNYLKIEINYVAWRKLFDELCLYYNISRKRTSWH